MKFKEQFPSLKGKRFCGWEYQCDDDKCSLNVMDVEEHCLDKKKVEKVIDEFEYLIGGKSRTGLISTKILKRELGL